VANSKKSIVFINQSSGYLMIDIIHAHLEEYDEIILLTGHLNPRNKPLDTKVKVHYLKKYNRDNLVQRIATWSLFFIQSLLYIFFKYRKSVIYFVSNPPFNLFSALFLKRPFTFLIYDIYPDVLAEQNYMNSSNAVYKVWCRINRHVFKKASRIFTISEGMKNKLEKYIVKDKIRVVPIWTDNTFLKPIPKNNNPFVKKHNLQEKFVVLYSGNLGITHPLEVLIEIANNILDPSIVILIIGEGQKKSSLKNKVKERSLVNVKFLPFQPTSELPYSLSAADLGVVTLDKKSSATSVPSKTYSLMSVGVPLLVIADHNSEIYQLVSTYNNGKVFDDKDIEDIISFIKQCKSDKRYHAELIQHSIKASKNYTKKNAELLCFDN